MTILILVKTLDGRVPLDMQYIVRRDYDEHMIYNLPSSQQIYLLKYLNLWCI